MPKWELLSVTVDSGAAESVVPEGQCEQCPTRDTEKSMAGVSYLAADGTKILNMGEVPGLPRDEGLGKREQDDQNWA